VIKSVVSGFLPGFLASSFGAAALKELLERGLLPWVAGEAIAATATALLPGPDQNQPVAGGPRAVRALPAAEHLVRFVAARTGLSAATAKLAVAVSLPQVMDWLRATRSPHPKPESP
jgi:hypothetical protein